MSILNETNKWVDKILPELNKMDQDALNQVYMRGPFAGWSLYQLKGFAQQLKDNNTNYPLHK